MKTTTIAAVAAVAFTLVCATGCTSTNITQMPGGWTPKPMAPGSYTVLNGGKPVSGSVKVDLLDKSNNDLTSSTMRKAVDSALAQCPGADALIDVTQDMRTTQKALMLGPIVIPKENSYTVFLTGIPVKTKE
ncbi:MAG: hypothetical protein IKH04_09820 [Kiritimatiellae bacterium]|nr:hypothetical protein [Kiritimatiellia bacterium]